MPVADDRWHLLDATPHPCSYRPGQVALTPLLLPKQPLSPEAFDKALEQGLRRAGPAHYRPTCPSCQACEALRVPIDRFAPSHSQRRVLRKGIEEITIAEGPIRLSRRHVDIYDRHKQQRGLAQDSAPSRLEELSGYYSNSGVNTRLVNYQVGDRLIAFSVVDLGKISVSSVYHAFDPAFSRLSPGNYSALAEMALYGSHGYRWYYLGLWVGDCRNLVYKANYLPHQRLGPNGWREYARADDPGMPVADT